MRCLQLPKNKFIRVVIKVFTNAAFIAILLIFMPEGIMKVPFLAVIRFLCGLGALILPIVLVIIYIWFPNRP